MLTAEALYNLYQATAGPNWINNQNWDQLSNPTTGNPCIAHGVLCDGDKNVVGIHLDSNNLQGYLPGTVFMALASLDTLSLYNNSISGLVPDHLLDLPLLEHIDLRNNQFTGPAPNFNVSGDYGACLLKGNQFVCHIDTNAPCSVDEGLPPCIASFNQQSGQLLFSAPSTSSSSSSHLSAFAIAGIAVGALLVVMGALTPAAIAITRNRRRSSAGSDEKMNLRRSSTGAIITSKDVKSIDSSQGPWWTQLGISAGFNAASSTNTSMEATANVRRFPVDGAFPGMPSNRHADDELPAFASNARGGLTASRRASDSIVPLTPTESAGLVLQDPILRNPSEDNTAPALVPVEQKKPQGLFDRLFSFGSSSTSSSANTTQPADEEQGEYTPVASRARSMSLTSADPKSLFSHQTAVAAAASTSSQAEEGKTYTGFTVPMAQSFAAKRAAAARAAANKKRGSPSVSTTRTSSQ